MTIDTKAVEAGKRIEYQMTDSDPLKGDALLVARALLDAEAELAQARKEADEMEYRIDTSEKAMRQFEAEITALRQVVRELIADWELCASYDPYEQGPQIAADELREKTAPHMGNKS